MHTPTAFRLRTPAALAFATAAAVAITACGSSGSKAPSTTQAAAPPATSTPAVTSSPAATSTPVTNAPASSGKQTAPGTKLKVGATAYVPFDTTKSNGQDGPTYQFAITISAIKTGSMSDFKNISLSGVPKGAVPYYVDVTITNVGKTDDVTHDLDPLESIGAVESGGLDTSVILSGDFPPCPQTDIQSDYKVGVPFKTCQIFFEKTPVTQVGYDGSSATLDQPVVWSTN